MSKHFAPKGAVDENGSGVSINISSLRDDELDFLCKPGRWKGIKKAAGKAASPRNFLLWVS